MELDLNGPKIIYFECFYFNSKILVMESLQGGDV